MNILVSHLLYGYIVSTGQFSHPTMYHYKIAQATTSTIGYSTVTTSYIRILCGMLYIYQSWESKYLIYTSSLGFSRTYTIYYDSTGPFSIAQV